jgi:hypothetical protein
MTLTIPPLTVRPIVHSAHLDEWLAIFRALGAGTLSEDPLWTELELDRGRVTLSGLHAGAREGEVSLGFETADLDAFGAAVRPADGMSVDSFTADHGESLKVVGRDGLQFLIDERLPGGGPLPEQPRTWIHALWLSPDVPTAAADLESLGLRRRLTETNGRTIDVRAAEGDVLVHVSDGGPVAAGVAVDATDLDEAHKALLDAGIAHDVIDESHGRTLKVPFPGGVDEMLWVTREDPEPVGVLRHF